MTMLLFVYGTLKNGHVRNNALDQCRYLGTAITVSKYGMYHYGGFPAVIDESCPSARSGMSLDTKIHGELWEVGHDDLISLDRIEGVDSNLFNRKLIDLESVTLFRHPLSKEVWSLLENKKAEAYLFMQDLRGSAQLNGFWPRK